MVSTAHSYAALQRRLEKISVVLRQCIPVFCGYSGSDVASRLMQRYAELSVFEFTKFAAATYRQTGELPADTEIVDCGGFLIDGDRQVRLSLRKSIQHFIEFAAYWGYGLLVILISIRFSGKRKQLTLLYGVGQQDLQAEGSDARFLKFCRNGKIQPLVSADCLVIQAVNRTKSTEPSSAKYSRSPLFMALRVSGLELHSWLFALSSHILAAASFLHAVSIFPALVLLGRDAACHAAAVVLNRDGCLKDVIFTNSNYFSQPLWFWALPNRGYGSHIIWYSQNNYPISYIDEEVAVPIPNLRYIRADIQWVWSDGFRNFLRDVCPQSQYRIVGPIVWHLYSGRAKKSSGCTKVALFDVTPVNQQTELRFGLLRNYYTAEIMSKFVMDVVEAARSVTQRTGINIEIVLKHKRPHHLGFHSSEYVETICELASSGLIALADPASNLFELISESAVVISAPYSSPVYIGKEAEKDTFWYDPTETLDWKLGTQEVPLIQGKNELVLKLVEILNNLQ